MSNKKRVVVTGFGAISPLGNDWESVSAKLKSCTNAVQAMKEWADIKGLHTRLGCPAAPFELDPAKYNRKSTRSMGRVGLLGVRATEVALADAGLLDNQAFLSSGDLGIAYGSSAGTPSAVADIASLILKRSTADMNANTYVRMMSHGSDQHRRVLQDQGPHHHNEFCLHLVLAGHRLCLRNDSRRPCQSHDRRRQRRA